MPPRDCLATGECRPEDYRKVTIGIDVSKYSQETFPKYLSIYCSNPAFEHLDFTYKLLPYITVMSNGNPLFIKEGLTYYKNNQTDGYEQIFYEQSIHNKIIEDVWDIHFEYDTGVIDVFMNALRKKLNLTKDQDLIKTIRGVGYIAND